MQGLRVRQHRRAQVHRQARRRGTAHLPRGRSVRSVAVAVAVLGLHPEDVAHSVGQVGPGIGRLVRYAPMALVVVLAVDPPLDAVPRRGRAAVVGRRLPRQGERPVPRSDSEPARRPRRAVAQHRPRRCAGRRLNMARIVDEAHPNLDEPARVAGLEHIGRHRRPSYVRVSCPVTGHPLKPEHSPTQPVGVNDARHVRHQSLAHPSPAPDNRRTGRGGALSAGAC